MPEEIRKLINDGGSRMDYGTGAVREDKVGKGRFDLISPIGMRRLAEWYELGAYKYAPRNWEMGVSITHCMDSLLRHAFKYLAGDNSEDHLSAVAWNAFAIMHMEEKIPHMMDIPTRLQIDKEAK